MAAPMELLSIAPSISVLTQTERPAVSNTTAFPWSALLRL
jgi:hypothetical protein